MFFFQMSMKDVCRPIHYAMRKALKKSVISGLPISSPTIILDDQIYEFSNSVTIYSLDHFHPISFGDQLNIKGQERQEVRKTFEYELIDASKKLD